MSKYHQEVNALLLKIKDGEKSKINDLVDNTHNHLKYVALYYLFSKKDVDDVVSETYYRVVKYIANFNESKDGYNWLCRIVQNVATDINKENCHYVSQDKFPIDDLYYFDETDDILARDALYQYVKTLPKIDRQIFYYRYYLDLPFDAIAKKLNRAKSFVHSRDRILYKKITEKFQQVEKF